MRNFLGKEDKMKFSEIKLDRAILEKQKSNLIKRTMFSIAALAIGVCGMAFLEFPSLKYPKAPGVILLILSLLACWCVFRIQNVIFDRNWVGTVEDVGLKTVIASGHKGRPEYKQAFYMTIRLDNGSTYDYQNLETVGEHPSEVEESSGMLRRTQGGKSGLRAGQRTDDSGDGIDGSLNRFGLSAPYAVGDTVVHLRGQKYFATYGKSGNSFAVCPFCGEIVIPEREKCYRCGVKVMK